MRLLWLVALLTSLAWGQDFLPRGRVMPALVGRETPAALQILRDARIPEPLVMQVAGSPAGRVVRQSPAAGEPLSQGAAPTLWVSGALEGATGDAPAEPARPTRGSSPLWWVLAGVLPLAGLGAALRLASSDTPSIEIRRS